MKIKILLLSCLVSLTNFPRIEAAEIAQTNSNSAAFNTNYTGFLKYFVLGQPTNDICVGILKKSQSDFYVCLLYIGQTNSHKFWIAPPKFQRVEYYLYDAWGKVVPYLATYHPASKIYKTIYEVPKNAHNVYEGLMGPPFTMPYEQIALTKVFQIEHDGDYKLIVKGRIMKINNDSSLDVVEFPAVSLPIHLDGEVVNQKTKEQW